MAHVINATRHAPSVSRRHLTRSQRRNLWFYVFLSPWIIGLICLTLFPVLYGFQISLTNYDGYLLEGTRFVGLANYARAFRDPDAIYSYRQTLFWVVLQAPAWVILSFALALLLNRDVRGRSLYRTLFYLPTVIPAVGVVATWKIILDQNIGVLNGLIGLARPGTAISWLGQYVIYGLLAISVWSGLGWGMVIFLAGLQGIPNELVEAAKIDGANAWRVFRHITLPLMTPVLFFQLVMSVISSFQQLVFPLLISANREVPSVPRGIYFFMVHTYLRIRNGFYGYGLALLWLLFVTVIALAGLIFWTERFWVFREDVQ